MDLHNATDFQILQQLCAEVGIDPEKIKENVTHPVVQELIRRLKEKPENKGFKPFDWLLGFA